MRSFTLLFFVSLVACRPPCESSTVALTSGLSCVPQDAGVTVRYRPYNALSENFVDSCVGRVDGGLLSFDVALRACEPGASSGPLSAECSLPSLEPGRYSLGESQLIIDGDGGLARCE